MLQQVTVPQIDTIFSVEVLSTTPEHIKRSFSLKQGDDSCYLCVKTMPLKFSIIKFQHGCLENIRSFTLHSSNKEITFLNLETKPSSLEEEDEKYEVLVGYQNGTFDIYQIIGDDPKLIEEGNNGSDKKLHILNVRYQPQRNQILIVNKNILTSIEITSPYRLIREQDIEPINCSDITKTHILAGRFTGIDIYEISNFKLVTTLDLTCTSIRQGLHGRVFIGNTDDSFCILNSDYEIVDEFVGFKSYVCEVIEEEWMVWVFNSKGTVACFKEKRKEEIKIQHKEVTQPREGTPPRQKTQQSHDQELNLINAMGDSVDEIGSQYKTKTEELEEHASNAASLLKDNEEGYHSDSKALKTESNQQLVSKEHQLTMIQEICPSGIVAVKMAGSLIFAMDNNGVLSVREVRAKK